MENTLEKNNGGLYGWICPVCGRGNSPFTSTCPCKPIYYKLTCDSQYQYTYPRTTTGGTINETY